MGEGSGGVGWLRLLAEDGGVVGSFFSRLSRYFVNFVFQALSRFFAAFVFQRFA